MAAPAAVLSILVRANTGSATTALVRFNQRLDDTEKHSHKAARAIETVAKAGTLIGGAAVIGGLTYAVKKAADFEQQMSSLGAVSDASARQMDRFRKQALRAGAATKFSALEAAQAQTELAKGGLSVKQIMRGGLRSALALAAAGEMDLADAATATVNAIKLFGLHGKDAMKVADGFATAANRTTADVSDFALAMAQGGSAAKAAGLTFGETTAALEALAEIGIKGSDAGTSLKVALLRLASPASAKAVDKAKELGINVFDASGKMKSLVDVSKELRDGLGHLNQQQRLQAATTLVGQDGMRALLALYDAGPKKIQGFEKGLNKQGTAADVAKKKQDNLKGSLENLGGSVETLAIQIGQKMLPALKNGADELTDFTNRVGKIFARDDLSIGEKLSKSFELAKVRAQPWIDKLKAAIDRANVPQKLAAVISAATPIIAKAAAKASLIAAQTFVKTFIDSSIWGRLLIGTWLLSRMGGPPAFLKLGATVGTSVGTGMGEGIARSGLKGRMVGLFRAWGPTLAIAVAATLGPELIKRTQKSLSTSIGNLDIKGSTRLQTGFFGDKDAKIKNTITLLEIYDKKLRHLAAVGDTGGFAKTRAELSKVTDPDLFDQRALDKYREGLQKLADQGKRTAAHLAETGQHVSGMSDRFAAALRGLRIKGSKDFQDLVNHVTFGSRQILKVGGEKSAQTREAIAKQFGIARKRVKEAMDNSVISVKDGTELLHQLAVKQLKLYGISAGRVNVVLAKGANGEARPNQRGGYQMGGKPTGDSIPSLLERGEYVLNRKAVRKVGKHKLDELNFSSAPRFQKGGAVGMQGGGSVTGDTDFLPQLMKALRAMSAAAHTPIFVQSGRRTVAEQLAQGPSTPGHPVAGPNGPHVRGVAADITPGFGVFGKLASKFGLGFTVMPQEPWHIQLLKSMGLDASAFKGLGRPVLSGPASVALEAGQGALDRVLSAANASVGNAIASSFGNGTESGAGLTSAGGAFNKSALKALWVRAGGKGSIANVMAAIALAESGGNPQAHNPSGASGLWQILGLPFPGNVFDPLTNARMAVSKYGSQGLGAWEAYTNGNYRQYLQRGGIVGLQGGGAPNTASGSGSTSGPGTATPGGANPPGLPGAINRALGKVRAGKSPKIRHEAVANLVEQIKKVGLPKGIQSDLTKFSNDASIFGEYADRAGALSTEDDNGNPIYAQVNGKNQAGWLTDELGALFAWRNTLIRAEAIVVKRREKIIKALTVARKRLSDNRSQLGWISKTRHGFQKQLDVAKKHPKRNKKLIHKLREQIRGLNRQEKPIKRSRDALHDKIIPALVGRRGALGSLRGDLLSNLDDVQGMGAPADILKSLPPVGVLGGQIFDVQMKLRDLAAPVTPPTKDDSADTGSDRADALAELLRQSNLRTAVSEAQFKVFQNAPPFGGSFATGGVVAGPSGAPRVIEAHGGEGVFTPDQMAAMGGANVTINVAPGMEWLRQFINVEVGKSTRQQARNAGRGLPGRGGGMIRG